MNLNNFGFVVTNIEAIIITATPNLLLNSYFRPTLLPSITFIDSEIPLILRNIEEYTNITYPMESISFIGLPNSSNDIIEIKQGLVIARWVNNDIHLQVQTQSANLEFLHFFSFLDFVYYICRP